MIGDNMTKYEVQAWDDNEKCVHYYNVEDAIDYEDARDVIAGLHPDKKVIAVVKRVCPTH